VQVTRKGCLDTVQLTSKGCLDTVQVSTKAYMDTAQALIKGFLDAVQPITQDRIVQLIIQNNLADTAFVVCAFKETVY
jgi:hypothetical protein